VHGVDDFLRRRVFREALAERGVRRAVDDDADVAAVGQRSSEEHGLQPGRIAGLRIRHQEHGLRFEIRMRRRRRGGAWRNGEHGEQCKACEERSNEPGHDRSP
jgi:hypothetical protein